MKKQIKNMNQKINDLYFKVSAWITGIVLTLSITSVAFADVGSSKLATGTEELVSDLTTWLMILSPTVTVLLVCLQ